MKKDRHQAIMNLIQQHKIDKQEDLLLHLRQAGFKVTQATVSRDIRELQLIKAADPTGGYRYVVAGSGSHKGHNANKFDTIFRESVINVDSAGHMVLVKCYSGMASAACEVFDSMQWDHVVGTLSGDDTFFILMRTEEAAASISQKLNTYCKK